ncbi:MAG: CTP synthase [Christensenellales bacterium]
MSMNTKYIFVSGGVVSSLGKGITAAALGRLLKARGLKIAIQKFDPYINIDPAGMSPFQHGEVYVTDDGAQCDLDVGHYERFIDENLTGVCNITSGEIYWSVILKERRGEYMGETVQVIPHITDEIKENVFRVAKTSGPDVVITEIGGTVGDMESQPFLEAVRQLKWELGPENCVHIHVTLVPYIASAGEIKTKPTQHSVRELRSIGIQPDIIVCRTEYALSQDVKKKLALFCNVEEDCVIENQDVPTLYEVPLMLEAQGLGRIVCKKLCLTCPPPALDEWKAMVKRSTQPKHKIKLALVGRFTELRDAYLSVAEATHHAGVSNETEVELVWLSSCQFTDEATACTLLEGVQGLLLPGSYDDLGVEGKLLAVQCARKNNLPFFGINSGMEIAVIEFARNVLHLSGANRSDLAPDTPFPVVQELPFEPPKSPLPQIPMRLGSQDIQLTGDSLASKAYGKTIIHERHRHRSALNGQYLTALHEKGLQVSGMSQGIVEIVELQGHPFFLGVQFNPEFRSRPNRSHPLFNAFLQAALCYAQDGSQLRLKL